VTSAPDPDPSRAEADAKADAVPDPRDRRRGHRRAEGDRRHVRARSSPASDRRDAPDRRQSSDRRSEVSVPDEYRAGTRNINEYPLEAEELEFINAINAYKQRYGKPFPTWSEVLHVVRHLGYRKPGTAAEAPPGPGRSPGA